MVEGSCCKHERPLPVCLGPTHSLTFLIPREVSAFDPFMHQVAVLTAHLASVSDQLATKGQFRSFFELRPLWSLAFLPLRYRNIPSSLVSYLVLCQTQTMHGHYHLFPPQEPSLAEVRDEVSTWIEVMI